MCFDNDMGALVYMYLYKILIQWRVYTFTQDAIPLTMG